MRHLTDELPYDITVEIEQYELEGEMQRIAARIFVDIDGIDDNHCLNFLFINGYKIRKHEFSHKTISDTRCS
jgi:hypothetical protein